MLSLESFTTAFSGISSLFALGLGNFEDRVAMASCLASFALLVVLGGPGLVLATFRTFCFFIRGLYSVFGVCVGLFASFARFARRLWFPTEAENAVDSTPLLNTDIPVLDSDKEAELMARYPSLLPAATPDKEKPSPMSETVTLVSIPSELLKISEVSAAKQTPDFTSNPSKLVCTTEMSATKEAPTFLSIPSELLWEICEAPAGQKKFSSLLELSLASKKIAETAKHVLLKRAETTLYFIGSNAVAENVIRMEVPHIWTKEEDAKEVHESSREAMDHVYALATIFGVGELDRATTKSVVLPGAFNPGNCVFIAKILEDRSGGTEPHPFDLLFDLLPGPILYRNLEAAAKACLNHATGEKVGKIEVLDEGDATSDSEDRDKSSMSKGDESKGDESKGTESKDSKSKDSKIEGGKSKGGKSKSGKGKRGKSQKIMLDWNEDMTVAQFDFETFRFQIEHIHLIYFQLLDLQ